MNDVTQHELLDSLPAVFRKKQKNSKNPEMAEFLVAFERILLSDGLEGQIDRLAETIDPMRAPIDDLRWIASWMGLTIDADYPTGADVDDQDERAVWQARYRAFVAQTMGRYRQRGTLDGMQNLLHHFTGLESDISGDHNAHRFVVSLSLYNVRDPNEMERLTRVAHALIQREKPAHTYYELKPQLHSFQVAILDQEGDRKWPSAMQNIPRHAQVGHREAGKITVGNMILGQAPSHNQKKISP